MPLSSSLPLAFAATLAFLQPIPVQDSGAQPRVRDTVWQAPVGHRQPRESNLPPSLRRDEGARTKTESSFDKSLQICVRC